MRKILITGANGQLGRGLIHELTDRGIQEKYSGSEQCEYIPLDITNPKSVMVS